MHRKNTHVNTTQRHLADSQRVQLAIPRGPQLYYKRFSRGIQISGTFGLHHVLPEKQHLAKLFFLEAYLCSGEDFSVPIIIQQESRNFGNVL
jgi:hypothetical protein